MNRIAPIDKDGLNRQKAPQSGSLTTPPLSRSRLCRGHTVDRSAGERLELSITADRTQARKPP